MRVPKQLDLCLQYYCRLIIVHCERLCHLFDIKLVLEQYNSQKCQVTVFTKSDIHLNQNSVHDGLP